MKINTKDNPIVKMYNGEAKSEDGTKYIVKLISFADPINDPKEETATYGSIRSGAFVEAPNGEIIARTFFPEIFDDEDLIAQGDYIVNNIDAILKDWKLNPDQIHKLCINQSL